MKRIIAALLAAAMLNCAAVGLAEGNSRADELLLGMSLEQKVYQMFIITPEALTGASTVTKSGDATKAALEKYPVGGLIYFSQNLKTRAQTTEMIMNTKDFAAELGMPGLFIAVDEEGGTVARVAGKLGTTKFKPMMTLAKSGDPGIIYDAYQTIARDIGQFGFNFDFAPVADIITNSKNTEIGNRAFGTDAETVSTMVPSAVRGLQDNGIIAAIKHFPGHGNTTVNSHEATSTTSRTLEEIREVELKPFEAGIAAGTEFVLVSHLTALGIDPESPASLSKPIITGILRDELGYDGLVVTDALRMKAVSDNYTPSEVASRAVGAGVDVLLMPDNFAKTAARLIELVKSGEIPESRIDESVRRIIEVKLKYGIAE